MPLNVTQIPGKIPACAELIDSTQVQREAEISTWRQQNTATQIDRRVPPNAQLLVLSRQRDHAGVPFGFGVGVVDTKDATSTSNAKKFGE